MTKGSILFLLIINLLSCTYHTAENNKKTIISKIKHKSNNSESDTLWVSQNDTSVFQRLDEFIHRPCSNAELLVRYQLKNPQDGAYYFIYNDRGLLEMEGKYTQHTSDRIKSGDFYNSKTYFYNKNGDLGFILFKEDGRSSKVEYYSKKELTKIEYTDKKTGETSKVEIYKNGHLKETRIYTSFDRYYVVKPENE